MRVIEERMLNAVRNKRNANLGNTSVVVEGDIVKVFLFGHKIYQKNYSTNEEGFSHCGWLTNTTKSRLNALGANIYQKDFSWYNADGTPFVCTI